MQHATGSTPTVLRGVWNRLSFILCYEHVCEYACEQSLQLYLEGVWHGQTNDAWAQGAFSHHRQNGSS